MSTEFTVTELKDDMFMSIFLACLEAEQEPTANDSIWQIMINGKVALFIILPTTLGKPQLYPSSVELLKSHPQLTAVMLGTSGTASGDAGATNTGEGWMAKLERENVDHAFDFVVTKEGSKLVGLLHTDTMRICSAPSTVRLSLRLLTPTTLCQRCVSPTLRLSGLNSSSLLMVSSPLTPSHNGTTPSMCQPNYYRVVKPCSVDWIWLLEYQLQHYVVIL